MHKRKEAVMIDAIVKIGLMLVNWCAVVLICYLIAKWMQRIERKQALLQHMIIADFNRYSILYLELLKRMKKEFCEKDMFKEAMQIQKLINVELERMKQYGNEK